MQQVRRARKKEGKTGGGGTYVSLLANSDFRFWIASCAAFRASTGGGIAGIIGPPAGRSPLFNPIAMAIAAALPRA